MRAVVLRLLDSPDDISVYDVLMVEFVLQPENKGEPGSMRAEYLKLLYVNEKDRAKRQGARMRKDIPSQFPSCTVGRGSLGVVCLQGWHHFRWACGAWNVFE